YISNAPDRFIGTVLVSFRDVEATMKEIRWAKEAGLKGVVLPWFSDEAPLFDPRFDPVWSLLEELEMPINSHIVSSSTTTNMPIVSMASLPHPGIRLALFKDRTFFFCREILTHCIFGGVLERHPRLQLVLTEQQTDWVVGWLRSLDYTYEGSYLRRDIRDVL